MRFQSAETLVNSARKLNITSREPPFKGNEGIRIITVTVLAGSAVEFFKTHKLERRDPRVRRNSIPRCSLDTQSRDTKLPAIGDGPNWIRRVIGYDVGRRGKGESRGTRFSPDGVSYIRHRMGVTPKVNV